MSGSAHYAVAWLATFSDGKRNASDYRVKHKWVNKEAEAGQFIHGRLQALEAEHGLSEGYACKSWISGHEIVGLVLLNPLCQHHALQPLDEEMRAQHDFWCALGGTPLDGDLFFFKVAKVEATTFGLPLAETSTGRNTCFFHLGHVWAARAFTPEMLGISQHRLQKWMLHTNGEIPTLTLRVPKAIALLALHEKWSTLAVPESLHQVNLGAGWLSKHVLKTDTLHELRMLQEACTNSESGRFSMSGILEEATPDLYDIGSRPGRLEFQGLLQEVASFMFQGRPMTDEAKWNLQVKLLSAAQSLQNSELADNLFRQESNFLQKCRKYSAIKLLNFFWIAGALQNDRDLRETLKQACLVSMPSHAAKQAASFIDGTGSDHDKLRVPSAATLSRVRGRLDVAWMLYFREHVVMPKLLCSTGNGVRLYIQTDATWQARQEYQVTLVNLVGVSDLHPLHKDRLLACSREMFFWSVVSCHHCHFLTYL